MATPPARPMAMDPPHITEFASNLYFTKLQQQQQQQQQQRGQASSSSSSGSNAAHNNNSSSAAAAVQSSPFILPLRDTKPVHDLEGKDKETAAPRLRQKKSRFHIKSLIHSKQTPPPPLPLAVPKHLPVAIELVEAVPEALATKTPQSFGEQFLSLPAELKIQIVQSMPLSDILSLRLTSKAMHAMVTSIESPIVRYHLEHNVPAYAKRLYPPHCANLDFRYLCGLWHRLHVAAKLSSFICQWVTKEIFLRTTELQRLEFAPQSERMRRRLIPLLFTIFHFFETYRARHLQYIIDHDGKGLSQTPYTINPIEAEIMNMYDDRTLLQVHQVFPLVVASFCRRLRPPSYVGRLEKSLRGYMKDKPADEVHVATLCIGGLRQVERFWAIKGYNLRRSAVDVWYNSVAKGPPEPAATKNHRRGLMGLGRKKTAAAASAAAAAADDNNSSASAVRVSADGTRTERGSMDDATWERCNNLIFNTSLADGMPMSMPSREQSRLLLSDLPVLQNLWLVTAEALILERKIVEKQSDIRRNAQVMLELIREDGFAEEDQWWYGQGSHDSLRPALDSIEEDVAEFDS